jgi:hypothetical protein
MAMTIITAPRMRSMDVTRDGGVMLTAGGGGAVLMKLLRSAGIVKR